MLEIEHKRYRDLLESLNEKNVHYLLVGSYATRYYYKERTCKDMDVLIDNSKENIRLFSHAMSCFGHFLKEEEKTEFLKNRGQYYLSSEGYRVDVLTQHYDGKFGKYFPNRKLVIVKNDNGLQVNIPSREHLIEMLEQSPEEKHRTDIKNLKNLSGLCHL